MRLSITAIFLACGLVAFADELPQHIVARKTKAGAHTAPVPLTNTLIVRSRTGLPIPGTRALLSSPGWGVMEFGSAADRDAALMGLRMDRLVAAVYVVPAVPVQPEIVIDDPYFPKDAPSAGYRGQWHLLNQIEAGRDINVADAYADDVTGLGVTTCIVDDGIQNGHEDIFPNYLSANSWDFANNDNNPSASGSENHGTAVAGVMAARGGNGIGVTGVAPLASISAIRVSFSAGNVITQLTDATLFKSSGADTAIKIKNHSYGVSLPFVNYSVLADALETSSAAGTIHVRSAGNYRGTSAEDANKSSDRGTPSAIVVGAMGNNGVFADYSNFGSNLTCCVPSNPTAGSSIGLLTTDRSGSPGYNGFPNTSYTPNFGGTSGAAPQVAGALALAKQIRPNLDARFAKHLIARSSRQVDAADASLTGGWVTNAAGLKFNPNYGFGLLDASGVVDLARAYSGVGLPATVSSGTISVNTALPDGTGAAIFRNINIASQHPSQKVEDVVVTLNVTHPWRGDVEGVITSPAGTQIRFLTDFGGDSGANISNWKFTVNGFWNEDPDGAWQVRLRDLNTGDVGTWGDVKLDVRMGYLIEASSTVSGTVDLLDWADETGKQVAYELLTGATVVQSGNLTLGAGGSFAFGTANLGAYDLRIKGRTWLAEKQAIDTSSNVSGLTFALQNGDVNGDNIVDIADYSYLAAAFDLDSSAPNWLTPDGNGIAPQDSDLNGDGIVDIADYTILATSFDAVGD